MGILCRWVLVLTVLFACVPRAGAAPPEETAFKAANLDFSTGFYDRAERQFAAFIQSYTNSSHLPEATLFQARARLKLGNAAGAIQLLSAGQAQAGKSAPEYLFWLAEAWLQKEDYQAASDAFAQLLQQFPGSPRRLEAAVEQATARAKLREWPRVVELLQQTNGAFQSAMRTNASGEWAQHGFLLLSTALLQQPDYSRAETALQPMAGLRLSPEIDWQRQYLLCRIQLGTGRTNDALQNSTNLLTLAAQAGQRSLQADSMAFRARLFEALGMLDQAIAAYTNNLAAGVPLERQQQALLKISQLTLAQNKPEEAIRTLGTFVQQYSNAPAADLALLTLGELRLRQSVAGLDANQLAAVGSHGPALTNVIAPLDELTKRFPQSPYVPKAQYYLGWCFWREGRLPECRTNFLAAALRLPSPLEQASAYFKLADTEFLQTNFIAAVAHYGIVTENYSLVPEVRTNLLEPALYQLVQAAVAAGDLARASNALGKLMVQFPGGFRTAPAVLVAGQEVARRSNPAGAREIFADFAKLAPQAPLLPLVHLAIARTYEEAGDWPGAARQYDLCLTAFTNYPGSADAEYYRARAAFLAGDETNALRFFTNFVVRFPTNRFRPQAQLWVGDYYFNLGDYRDAELSYKPLFENASSPRPPLYYQGLMMAGRAASRQQLWNNAIPYFTNLTGDGSCPADIWGQAMFAYGDCIMNQQTRNPADTKNSDNLKLAISIYSQIYERYPTSEQAVLALGEKGNALAQLALCTGQSEYFTNALEAYQQVSSNRLDFPARSMAKVGQGIVLERLAESRMVPERNALLDRALDHYLDVYHEGILAGKEANQYWTVKAGQEAIRLAEALQMWRQAIAICQQLRELYPPLRATLDHRIEILKEKQRRAPNGN